MINKLKTLGLAVVAVFAMSALVATAASAAEFHSAGAPTTLTGSQNTTNAFHVPGAGTVHCTSATFHTTQSTTTTKELTVHPTYSGCTAFGFGTAHVTTTGCDYTFTQPNASLQSVPHIVCSGTNLIRITPTVFTQMSVCTVTVGTQSPNGNVKFTNQSGKVLVTSNVTGISHSAGCGASAAADGTYTGTVLMQGSAGEIDVG